MAITKVSTSVLEDGSVHNVKIADNAVNASKLNVADNGTSGQVLLSDGDGTFSWGDRLDSLNYDAQVISANTNAVKDTVYVLTADLTLTLPASPLIGDSIKISNLSGVDTCIIGANGSLIMGVSGDLTLNTATASFELVFTGTTKGWVIIGPK